METVTADTIIAFFGIDTVAYTAAGKCYHVVNCPVILNNQIKVKRINVTFLQNALKWKLRPCQRCKPLEHILYNKRREEYGNQDNP